MASDLFKIARAIGFTETWQTRLDMAFELYGVSPTREDLIKVTSALVDKLHFEKIMDTYYEQVDGEVIEHVTEVETMNVDDSKVTDEEIMTEVETCVETKNMIEQLKAETAALKAHIEVLSVENAELIRQNESSGEQLALDLEL